MTAAFASALARARFAAGLSRAELGHRVGVSDETIRRWERGDYEPRSFSVARRLDQALGTAFETMLFGADDVTPDGVVPISAADMERAHAEILQLRRELADLRSVLGSGQPRRGAGPTRRGSRPLVTTP
jgi:transcriptional regulator with XRE-family HTH domain